MFKAGDNIIAILDAYPSNYPNPEKESFKIPKGTQTHILDVGKVYNNTQLIKIATGGVFTLPAAFKGKMPCYYSSCFTLYEELLDIMVPIWYTIG